MDSNLTPVTIKIDAAQLAEIDDLAKDLAARAPGMKVTRTDAIRVALTAGLESQRKKPAKR